MELRYHIPLPPVTKKNSQQILVNRATGRPFVMPSKKFRQYERDAKLFLKKLAIQIRERRPGDSMHWLRVLAS